MTVKLNKEQKLELENVSLKLKMLDIQASRYNEQADAVLQEVCNAHGKQLEDVQAVDYVTGQVTFKEPEPVPVPAQE